MRVKVTANSIARELDIEVVMVTAFNANYTPPKSRLIEGSCEIVVTIPKIKPSIFVLWMPSDVRFYGLKCTFRCVMDQRKVKSYISYRHRQSVSDTGLTITFLKCASQCSSRNN